MNLDRLSTQLRPLASIETDYPNITYLEKEIIAKKASPAIECAVIVLLFQEQEEYYLTLIQRPMYEGTHGGQIAFAGGKKDANDKNLLHTAIRECEEEIGVIITEQHILGALSDIYIVPSHSLVTPFVTFLPQKPTYQPAPREVAYMIEIKLQDFLNPAYQSMQSIKVAENKELKLPAYHINGHTIWGATGRMISVLMEKISKSL